MFWGVVASVGGSGVLGFLRVEGLNKDSWRPERYM